jgi:hypothetical protein
MTIELIYVAALGLLFGGLVTDRMLSTYHNRKYPSLYKAGDK